MDLSAPLMHHDPDRFWITDPDPDHPKGMHPGRNFILYKFLSLTVLVWTCIRDFLTARPWAERGSFSTRGLFFVFSATRPKLLLGQILIHATCDVYSPKAVETLLRGQCYEYCFLYCVYNIFSFGFIEALDSKGILNVLKKVLRQPWHTSPRAKVINSLVSEVFAWNKKIKPHRSLKTLFFATNLYSFERSIK